MREEQEVATNQSTLYAAATKRLALVPNTGAESVQGEVTGTLMVSC